MIETIAEYGPRVAAWVFAALSTLLSTYVWVLIRAGYAREALQRAWVEVQGAVLEVTQTYSSAIKAASIDGLTDAEKATAKAQAIAIAKENLGKKGLSRLARVIGVDVDQWLASKTEQAVALTKLAVPVAPKLAPVPR